MNKIIILCILLSSVLLSHNIFAKPINVNSADIKTLSTSLKNIGQKKAARIVKYRTEHGEFKSLTDLMKVKGIGQKTIDKNATDILFTDPEYSE